MRSLSPAGSLVSTISRYILLIYQVGALHFIYFDFLHFPINYCVLSGPPFLSGQPFSGPPSLRTTISLSTTIAVSTFWSPSVRLVTTNLVQLGYVNALKVLGYSFFPRILGYKCCNFHQVVLINMQRDLTIFIGYGSRSLRCVIKISLFSLATFSVAGISLGCVP